MLTDLVELPGGSFRMGSTSFYPDEAPVHTVTVAAFAIERHPVTNAQFAEFVADTGYVTVAEQPTGSRAVSRRRTGRPGARRAGVPARRAGPVDLRDWRQWWDWAPGAYWRHPFGPGIDDRRRQDRPIIPWCRSPTPTRPPTPRWAGPAAAHRSGVGVRRARRQSTTTYAWGDDAAPGRAVDGQHLAGPASRTATTARWAGSGTSPVGTFPPNGFGLVDMIGNVWEWTTTRFAGHHRVDGPAQACCASAARPDPAVSQALKGGSHLCAPEYCHRYRPAARSPQSQDSATTHIGFRCVLS